MVEIEMELAKRDNRFNIITIGNPIFVRESVLNDPN